MEDSFRDTQGSRQKTGCGPGTAYIQGSIGMNWGGQPRVGVWGRAGAT